MAIPIKRINLLNKPQKAFFASISINFVFLFLLTNSQTRLDLSKSVFVMIYSIVKKKQTVSLLYCTSLSLKRNSLFVLFLWPANKTNFCCFEIISLCFANRDFFARMDRTFLSIHQKETFQSKHFFLLRNAKSLLSFQRSISSKFDIFPFILDLIHHRFPTSSKTTYHKVKRCVSLLYFYCISFIICVCVCVCACVCLCVCVCVCEHEHEQTLILLANIP
jgi:hypothetical protein